MNRQSNDVVANFQDHAGNTPFVPMTVLNGFLTRARNRANPTTDIDHAPREFRRFVSTGAQDVQISNGLWRKTGFGRRLPISYVAMYYAAVPRIPGQMRDDVSGKHKRGIDPLSYQKLVDMGPGAQPANPGGPGKIGSDQFYNPGTS